MTKLAFELPELNAISMNNAETLSTSSRDHEMGEDEF